MELDRIQLDESGGLIPTLKGGVQTFQDIADTSQNNINALPDTGVQGFLKGTAQVPQDFFNVIAHPVKTAQESYDYYKENPLRLLPQYATQEQATKMSLDMLTNPQQAIPQYGGKLLGQGLTLAALGGLGNKATPVKPTANLPIRGSLGGDALAGKPYSLTSVADFLGNSKIPSVKPRTLKVYHGSNVGDLTYLDKAYSGKNTPAVALNTNSVSENPAYAKNYALQGGRDGYLYQGEITPANFIEDSIPINRQLKQQNLLNIANEYGINPNTKGLDFFNYLQENYNPAKHGNIPIDKYLRRQGIDGVHFKNQMEYATTQNLPVQKILNIPYTEKNIYEIP